MSAIATIAGIELASAVRRRWTQFFTLAFTLIVVAMAASSGALHEPGGGDGLGRTSVALVPIVLAMVPMIALLLGVTGHAGEPGSEAFLFTQPVSRLEVLLGKWAGQVLAVSGAVALGLGGGGAIVIAHVGAEGWPAFATVALAAVALGAVFLALAACLASAIPRRGTVLGAAVFAWFCFVLLYDGAMIALAQSLTGRAGTRVLFVSVFGNPVDLVRLLVLAFSETPHILGAAGESWTRFLGGPGLAVAMSVAALAAWIIVPLAIASRTLARRDL